MLSFLALALSVVALRAGDKIDLKRTAPVPADQPIPTQDFFRPQLLSQPVLNRAGSHIAAIVTGEEDKQFVLVYSIATEKADSVGFAGDRDIYGLHWLGNSRLVFNLASRKLWNLGIMVADVGDLTAIRPIQQYSDSQLVSIPLKDPEFPLVWNRRDMDSHNDTGVAKLYTNNRNHEIFDLTVAMNDLSYGRLVSKVREQNSRCLRKSYPTPPEPEVTYSYMADKEGELAYAFTSLKGNLSLYRLENEKWIKCPVDLEKVDILGVANEPGVLLVRGPSADGKPYPLQLMEAATGRLGDVVLQDKLYDFNGWIYRNPGTGDALGAVFDRSGPRVAWFNEEYKTLQQMLDAKFPGKVVRIYGSDEKHEIFLVATYSDRQPVVYHWVNLVARKMGVFKSTAPWIDPQRMQPMQIAQFKTRDGYKLDAYLTLPAGASKEHPAPLVVLCHGGPWVRDSWGYDGEVQFLAHHGYAVLQPNYRGSTGSVGRFPAGDEYDFVKMHDDVTDAVRALSKVESIDANRIAIMGGSFGGYLAVSGVAHEEGLYRCAVTNAGVFDWAMQVQAEKYDQYSRPYYGRMIKTLGDPRVEVEKYERMSPLRFAQNIKVPVFVAGGKEDSVVEISQSKKLIAALDKNHVPYEKLFIGGEGHGMGHLKNQVELYDRILVFLDQHLKAAK